MMAAVTKSNNRLPLVPFGFSSTLTMCYFEFVHHDCGHVVPRRYSYCHFARNDPFHSCFSVKIGKRHWPPPNFPVPPGKCENCLKAEDPQPGHISSRPMLSRPHSHGAMSPAQADFEYAPPPQHMQSGHMPPEYSRQPQSMYQEPMQMDHPEPFQQSSSPTQQH